MAAGVGVATTCGSSVTRLCRGAADSQAKGSGITNSLLPLQTDYKQELVTSRQFSRNSMGTKNAAVV